MSDEWDLSAEVEAAWADFRGRLADRTAGMDDDDVLIVEFSGVVDDECEVAPYVQLCAYGGDLVRAEAVSNHWLDARCALSAEAEEALVALGWCEPRDKPGWENYYLTFERRSADEVAVLAVRTLREVYGVPHPAFLEAGGLEIGSAAVEAAAEAEADLPTADDESVAAFVSDQAQLQRLVDDAVAAVNPDLTHDSDGDIPILTAESVVFIRVRADRPAVEVFAEVLVDVEDTQRLLVELDLLNSGHPLWKFTRRGTVVTMRVELPAVPFAPAQLRTVVDQFVTEVDEIGRALAVRVKGTRFFESAPAAIDADTDVDDAHTAMTGLLELLHLDRVRATTVAGLFEHDRHELIRQIVRIRTGLQDCGEHDQDVVLTLLRKALRIVSDGDADAPRAVPLPPKPRSVQESLLPDSELGDDALDLGWSA